MNAIVLYRIEQVGTTPSDTTRLRMACAWKRTGWSKVFGKLVNSDKDHAGRQLHCLEWIGMAGVVVSIPARSAR